jgi:hypothetical protein
VYCDELKNRTLKEFQDLSAESLNKVCRVMLIQLTAFLNYNNNNKNQNQNQHAYAGQLHSFTRLRTLLVLHAGGILGPVN